MAFYQLFHLITGLPVRPVIKWAFGRLRRKTASRGREDTRVWYLRNDVLAKGRKDVDPHGRFRGEWVNEEELELRIQKEDSNLLDNASLRAYNFFPCFLVQ